MTEIAVPTTTVEQTVRIAATPATVWTFWTEPDRLRNWWGDGTELVLRHTELPTEHALDHTQGWRHFVGDRLVAVVSAR